MREISVSAVDEGQRLDKYLTKYMPEAPKSFFYKMKILIFMKLEMSL